MYFVLLFIWLSLLGKKINKFVCVNTNEWTEFSLMRAPYWFLANIILSIEELEKLYKKSSSISLKGKKNIIHITFMCLGKEYIRYSCNWSVVGVNPIRTSVYIHVYIQWWMRKKRNRNQVRFRRIFVLLSPHNLYYIIYIWDCIGIVILFVCVRVARKYAKFTMKQ